MSLAIAILANQNLNRVVNLVQSICAEDVKLCIHIDANVNDDDFEHFCKSVSEYKGIIFSKRVSCEWGMFSLVQAELEMCNSIIETWPDTKHIQLISGDSIPIRPIADLKELLSKNSDADFIESVNANDNDWVVDGLNTERFTLFFPLSWKKQRWLFDAYVYLQRKLGVKRHCPSEISPHIGSQWWCLTTKTIKKILTDPSRQKYDAFFKKCWIPDESYFQTLVRKHSDNIQSKSTVFSHFDYQGKPIIFYDDMADTLGDIDAFFVRKVWSGANGLYAKMPNFSKQDYTSESLKRQITQTTQRRKEGRKGLRMAGKVSNQWHEHQPATSAPYSVFTNVKAIFPEFDDWFASRTQFKPLSDIFAPDRAYFDDNSQVWRGGISCSASIRDADIPAFLTNIRWQTRNEGMAFHYSNLSSEQSMQFITQDPNAHVFMIKSGWLLDLVNRQDMPSDELSALATKITTWERKYLSMLSNGKHRCKATVLELSDVLHDPALLLSNILAAAHCAKDNMPLALPTLVSEFDITNIVEKIKNAGVDIPLSDINQPIVKTDRIAARND